jgi:thiol:disulfide interchange protein DsbA
MSKPSPLSSHGAHRRQFHLAAVAAAALPLGWSSAALAQSAPPKAGKDYIVLDKPVDTEAPAGKVEVIEFFWYSCPHCFAFEPAFEHWAKALPSNVMLRRVPVHFRDDFFPQQKLYYALVAMGKVDELHTKVFDAIHKEHLPLNTDAAITAWIVKQGVDKAKFLEAYNSFSVNTNAKRAAQIQDEYKVEGVPALGVAGKYYIDGNLAGSMDRALVVADYLIAQTKKSA